MIEALKETKVFKDLKEVNDGVLVEDGKKYDLNKDEDIEQFMKRKIEIKER